VPEHYARYPDRTSFPPGHSAQRLSPRRYGAAHRRPRSPDSRAPARGAVQTDPNSLACLCYLCGIGIAVERQRFRRSEVLDRWLNDSVRGTVKESTYATYSCVAGVHISPALGRIQLKHLTPAHVRGFYGEKSRTKLSAATVKKMHVVLRKALAQALSDGVIPRNAADGVKLPWAGGSTEEIQPLNFEECVAFLKASREERLEALYVLAVHCGLREGELLALRWEDVDLDVPKPALLVRRTLRAERKGADGSWAQALSPARDGACG
jgi:Phage integrase, N-terminal SAM-like domain